MGQNDMGIRRETGLFASTLMMLALTSISAIRAMLGSGKRSFALFLLMLAAALAPATAQAQSYIYNQASAGGVFYDTTNGYFTSGPGATGTPDNSSGGVGYFAFNIPAGVTYSTATLSVDEDDLGIPTQLTFSSLNGVPATSAAGVTSVRGGTVYGSVPSQEFGRAIVSLNSAAITRMNAISSGGGGTFYVGMHTPVNQESYVDILSAATLSGNSSGGTPVPAISINDVSLTEGNSGTKNFTFTVSLSTAAASTVTVDARGFNGTASAAATPPDWVFTGISTLSFAPGETTKSFTIAVNGDIDVESDEQFTVVVSNATNATIADNTGVGTILNDDYPPPTVTSISPTSGGQSTSVAITGTNFLSATSVTFGATAASFTINSATSITATAPTGTGTVDVRVVTPTGTSPTSAADQFTYVTPTVTSIAPNAGPATGGTVVTITGTNFTGVNAVSFGGTAASSFTFNSATSITATSPAGTGTVDVRVTTSGGTSATSAADRFTFVPAPTVTSVAPNAGPTTGGTSVTITGTNFSGTTAVTFGATPGAFTVNSATSITATAPAGTGTVDVRVTTTGGTSATSAADQYNYVPAPTVSSVSPASGPTSGGTTVTITGTNFSSATAVTFGANPALSYTVNSASQITATSPSGAGTIDIRITTAGGTSATSAADRFTYLAAPTVTNVSPNSGSINGGQAVTITGTNLTGTTSVTFGGTAATAVTVVSATTVTATTPAHAAGLVNVALTTGGGTGTLAGGYTYLSPPNMTVNDVTLAEGNAGTTAATFTVSLSAASSDTITVNYATADGTALAGSDYVATSGTLTFTPGQTSKTVNVQVNGDTVYEAVEQFALNLSGVTNAALADAQGIATITNDDAAPTFTINDVNAAEGNSGNTLFAFTVTRTGATELPVAVNYATADGTATTAGNDYIAASGTLTFLPSLSASQTQVINISVVGDTKFENTEQFAVNLSGPTNGTTIADAQGIGTITNDDAAPTITINDISAAEGNSGTTAFAFTVALSAASDLTATVNYSTGDGTALAGSDYAAASGTVTFAPGQTAQSVTILVNGDTLYEPIEQFAVNLSGSTNATIADAQGIGTIINDDGAPSLSINDVTVVEGNSGTTSAIFTVTLSGSTSLPIAVNYATADGTAQAGSDYIATSGTLTFNASLATSQTLTISVQVNGDTLFEPAEQFAVNLSGPTNGSTIADAQGIGTITNDDAPPPTLVSAAPNVGPTSGGQVVTLSGTNFTGATSVTFGGTAGTGLTVVSASSATVTTPAHASGVVNIAITTPGGTATLVGGYTFANAPTVTSLSPTSGPETGGTVVTITGSDFTGATAVTFGGANAAAYTVNSASSITATAPAGTGTVDVRVTAIGGTSATSAADRYSYVAAPIASNRTETVGYNGSLAINHSSSITGSFTSVAIGAGPAHGTLTPSAPGNYTNATYTSTTGYSGPDSYTYTATGIGGTSNTATVSITVAAPTITINPATLPAGTSGIAYSQAITATGGAAPYTYGITAGAVPAGLTLSTTGTLSGTPTASGSFTFSVTATDSSTGTGPFSATRSYTLAIAAPTLTLAPPTLTNATVGSAYSATISASGGIAPYTYIPTAGALPPGISLSSGGTLSGTPTAGGTFTFTITATDSTAAGSGGPYNVSGSYTLTVNAAVITLAPPTLPAGQSGVSYNQTISATGGTAPYSYGITAGALPAGLTLSSTGTLSGTPTASGSFTFAVTATDSSTGSGPFSATRTYTLSIAAPALSLAPTSLTNAIAGSAYSTTITASGGTAPYSYARTAGALPAGMTLSTGGVLSGTPTAGGSFTFTVTATDATPAGSGGPYNVSRSYTLTVDAATVAITNTVLPAAQDEVAYSQTLTSTGGVAPYTYAVTAGALPTGLTLSTAGVLSGTPATHGSFSFSITVTDSSTGTGPFRGTRSYTLAVAESPLPDPTKDPTVRAISTGQAEATRRFANAQINNFSRRTEQLHGDGSASRGSSMGVALNFSGLIDPRNMQQDLTQLNNIGGGTNSAYVGQSMSRADAVRTDTARKAAPDQPAGADASDDAGGGRRVGSVEIWSGGSIAVGNRDATSNTAELAITSSGLSAGIDIKLSNAITIGLGGGYGFERSKIRGTADHVNSNNTVGVVYASAAPVDGMFIDAIAGIGSLDFDTRRVIAKTGDMAQGQRDGSMTFGSIAAGFDHHGEKVMLSAYGRLDYLDASLDQYTETGAGRFNLTFNQRDLSSLSSTLGLRVAIDSGIWTPRIRAEWQHEFQEGGIQTLFYAGVPGVIYQFDKDAWLRDAFSVEVGTDVDVGSWRFGADIGGAFGKGSAVATGRITVTKAF